MVKSLSEYNPIPVLLYFLTVTGLVMFCMNPVILVLSLTGAVVSFLVRNGSRYGRTHILFAVFFAAIALTNPLFNHNGKTILFVMNDNPVTFEALVYGTASAAMIISVVYWFRLFSQIMTGDRLLYLFGFLSPKLALLISMTLRYIPLFGKQTKKVRQAQKALGLYREDNAVDTFRGELRIFSVMVSWGLENGIITADSMTARGYGTGKRSFYSLYRFQKKDLILLLTILVLFAVTACGIGYGALRMNYYPEFMIAPETALSYAAYVSYGLLAFLPAVLEAVAGFLWRTARK